jgi:tetratricopeptide (TPR) repeat protein
MARPTNVKVALGRRIRDRVAAYRAARNLDIAQYWQARDELVEAYPYAQRAVALVDGNLSTSDDKAAVLVVRVLTVLADLQRRLADCPSATLTLDRALCLAESLDPPAPTLHAAVLTLQGILAKELGAYDEAACRYTTVGEIYAEYGATSAELATFQHNLAGLAYARRRHIAAERHARWAISLRRATPAADVDVSPDRAVLAAALAGQRRYGEARDLLHAAMAQCAAARPPRRYEIAVQVHNLADIEQATGHAVRAEGLYRRAITMKEQLLGHDHPEVALIANNLGTLLHDMGRRADAEQQYRRALAIAERRYPEGHPVTVAVRENLDRVENALDGAVDGRQDDGHPVDTEGE